MDSQKFFCHLPFVSVLTDGIRAVPCCKWTSKKMYSLQEYAQEPAIAAAKEKLFQGQSPEECQKCAEEERLSGKSFRILANEFHAHLTQEVLEKDARYNAIRYVEVVGSNVCNLKCLPCEQGSFIRSMELYDLGYQRSIPITEKIKDITNISNLDMQYLTLCNGEPFYDKNTWNLLELLCKKNKSKEINLLINTNLTNITQQKLDWLIDNFKSLLIKGSIDGVGKINDYLRYPSTWHTICESVDLILSNPKIEFVVITALSNLSLLRYHELIQWCHDKTIKDQFISQVKGQVLDCINLPQPIKKYLKPIYQDLLNNLQCTNRVRYCLEMCINICDSDDTKFQLKDLQMYLDKHDLHRGSDWTQIFPELISYIDKA